MGKIFILKLIAVIIVANVMLFSANCFSQGVAINTTGAAADASAAFEVSSTSGGVLISRMTMAERNSISNPSQGLLVINTTTNCLEIYFSPLWQEIYCGCNPPAVAIAGTNIPTQTDVKWVWHSVSGATGY